MMHFSALDIVVISIYFIIVLVIGFWAKRKNESALDYFLAGRTLTLPIFVMTLVSTWYGGILGVGEYSYRYGLANWVTQGFPYYFFAALFAFFMAHKIRQMDGITIPDQLESAYGRRAGLLGAFFTFFLTTPAPYALMLGILLQMVTGWSLPICFGVGAILSVVYLIWGGLRADVYTDVFEFVVMFLGIAVILPFCFQAFGGLEEVRSKVPELHFSFTGGQKPQKLIVWFLIAFQTFADPTFFQRCSAARDVNVAKKGILISILFWFIFDAITTTAGLYARAALPDLKEPMMSYPLLAEKILPGGFKGFFFVGMLATIMSTLNSSAFVSATTLGRDIVCRWRNLLSDSVQKTSTAWFLVVTTAVAVLLASYIPSVVDLWYSIGSIFVPGILLPLILSYRKGPKMNSKQALTVMLAGWVPALAWYLFRHYLWDIEPMLIGLSASLLSYFVIRGTATKLNSTVRSGGVR